MIKRGACIVSMAIAVPAVSQTASQSASQPLTRSAYVQELDKAFARADLNNDGFADRAEIEVSQSRNAAARKARMLREREVSFRQLDTNKDGVLSIREFNSVAAAAPLPKPDAADMLNRLDADHDGRISRAENRVPSLARFDSADADGDGILSPEEQRARARH